MFRKKAKERKVLSQQMQKALQEEDWECLKVVALGVMAQRRKHPTLFSKAFANLHTAVLEIAVKQDPENSAMVEIARAYRLLQKRLTC